MRRTSKSWADYLPPSAKGGEEVVVEAAEGTADLQGAPSSHGEEVSDGPDGSDTSSSRPALNDLQIEQDDEEIGKSSSQAAHRNRALTINRTGWCPSWKFLDMYPPWLIFIEEVFVHVFYPFSLLVIIPLRGMPYALNKAFIPGFGFLRAPETMMLKCLYFFMTWNYLFAPCCINLFLFTVRRDLLYEFAVEIGVLNFLFVYRNCFTALRYALMDSRNRATIYYSRNIGEVKEAQKSTMMMAGYFTMPIKLRMEMLEASSKELAIDMDTMRLSVSLEDSFISGKDTLHLNSVLHPLIESTNFRADPGNSSDSEYQSGSIPLREVAQALIDSVGSSQSHFNVSIPCSNSISRIIWLWSCCLGIGVPILVRYRFYSDPQDVDWTYPTILFAVMICTMCHLSVVAAFVIAAVVGMYRQAILAKHLTMMICPSIRSVEPVSLDIFRVHWWGGSMQWKGKWLEERDDGRPIVDVARRNNVYAWFKLRQLVLNFGLKFHIRTSLICGSALTLAAALLALVVWELFKWRNLSGRQDDHDVQQL